MEITKNLDYYYVRAANYGTGFDVMGVGTHPQSSVLAGQERVVFLDSYETEEECYENYPQSKGDFRGAFTEPQNYFDHL